MALTSSTVTYIIRNITTNAVKCLASMSVYYDYDFTLYMQIMIITMMIILLNILCTNLVDLLEINTNYPRQREA